VPILVNDLDVVGAFRYACVDECLRILRPFDGRNGEAVLGSVPAGRGDDRDRGAQIGHPGAAGPGELGSQVPGTSHQIEHVELGGHSEHQSLFKSVPEGVRMAVDQARQERSALTFDDPGAFRRGDSLSYSRNPAIHHQDIPRGKHPVTVEHPHRAKQDGRLDQGDLRRGG
jgi:hypothetical protein